MRSCVARPVLPFLPVTRRNVVVEDGALAPVQEIYPYQCDEGCGRGDAAEEGVAPLESGQLVGCYMLHAHHKGAGGVEGQRAPRRLIVALGRKMGRMRKCGKVPLD